MTDIVPKNIAAGVNFTASAWRAEFSGTDWSLVLILRGPASIDLTADRDGARHVWDIVAADTAAWAPGTYAYQVRATSDDGDAVIVESGMRTIAADFAALAPGAEVRTPNRIALDAIEAVIAKRATVDQRSYRIRSGDSERELERMSVEELLKLRGHYRQLVREETPGARSGFYDIKVAMRPIGK